MLAERGLEAGLLSRRARRVRILAVRIGEQGGRLAQLGLEARVGVFDFGRVLLGRCVHHVSVRDGMVADRDTRFLQFANLIPGHVILEASVMRFG